MSTSVRAAHAVERVNGRLKDNLILDDLRVRGQKKVKVKKRFRHPFAPTIKICARLAAVVRGTSESQGCRVL